jgi:SAM-dependent methyltransferase
MLRNTSPSVNSARTAHRVLILALAVVAAVLSLVLYGRGTSWWYTPLALPSVVVAHVAVLGAILFIAARGRRRPIPQGGARHARGDGMSPERPEGELLHRPRLFDWLVRIITLGRERELRRWMLDLGNLKSGDAVLDVGSGTGTLLLAAAERVGPSGALRGVEPSPEMAARSRRKAEAKGVTLEISEGSADQLPYRAASFDAVFCTLVLHHLPESMRQPAIREIRRVLRPGGRAALIDWQRPKGFGSAITSGLFLIFLIHSLRPGGSPPTVTELEPWMIEAGFENVTRHEFGNGVLVATVGRVTSDAEIDTAEMDTARHEATPVLSLA